ncbi:MAG: methylated-DNA--[protein]-cysteine S-methyltransferase [Dehalococcoidia bacterium]
MNVYLDTVASPAGPLQFAVNDDGSLIRTQFAEGSYRRGIEQQLRAEGFVIAPDPDRTAAARQQLTEYAAGERKAFDLPLVLAGCDWQRAVWQALQTIPFGETRTYAQVAELAGQPDAARDAGWANATNRLPLVVPCHRVIGADGSLKGFAGGLHLKVRLLEHEGAMLRTSEQRA